MASMVAYTERAIEAFPALDWPEWTADRQPPGSRLAGGDPVCTVFASAGSAAAARRALRSPGGCAVDGLAGRCQR